MTKIKNIITICFAMAMMMVALVGISTVYAEETPIILVESKVAAQGETVSVTISVKNNPGIASMKLKVAYDDILTLTNITYNTAIGGQFQQPQTMASPVTLNWFNGASDSTGDWVFATLNFKVSENAGYGDAADITISYDPYDVYNIAEENVSFNVEAGQVVVKCLHKNKTEVAAKESDCENGGNNAYYVCQGCAKIFNANGNETTIEAETLSPLGHDLSEATCIAPATCKRGCGYAKGVALGHDWSEKIQDSVHLKDAATNCTEYDSYWCDCSRCDTISTTDFFTSTICGKHDFSEKIENEVHLVSGSGVDCQRVKQYYYDCKYCTEIGIEIWDSEIYGEHQMDSVWTVKDGKHYHTCTVEGCDYKEDEADCSGGTATCTEKAVCEVCNNEYGELNAHEYEAEWSQGDATGHWHNCKNCAAHDIAVAHIPGNAATETTPQTCAECGYVIEDVLEHIGGEWNMDEAEHWKNCVNDGCGIVMEESKGAHSDEDNDGKCDACDYSMTKEDVPNIPEKGDSGMKVLVLFTLCGAVILVGTVFRRIRNANM